MPDSLTVHTESFNRSQQTRADESTHYKVQSFIAKNKKKTCGAKHKSNFTAPAFKRPQPEISRKPGDNVSAAVNAPLEGLISRQVFHVFTLQDLFF